MKSRNEKIERIPCYFVNNDCSQITLPFRNNITLFSSDICNEGILCHYDFNDDSQNVNKYLLDERKNDFPYANIPIYKGLLGVYYINQLFEYNKHYITLIDGNIRDRYLIKDNNEVILLNRNISIPLNIIGSSYSSKEIKVILSNINALMVFDCYGRQYFDGVKYLHGFDSFINNGGGIFVLKEDNDKIKIKVVRIKIDIGYDNYIYREYDLSLNDYTLEELKYFCSKIKDINEPCVYSVLNPNIEIRDIKEVKKLVRKLNKLNCESSDLYEKDRITCTCREFGKT